jgi:glutathione S-transferase
MELYYAPGSCAFASLVSFCEAEADFTPRRVMLANGDQNSSWFRAINPRGRVPVLVAGGQTISETIAILSFVAHRYPERRLLPLNDPVALARAYELMSWLATGVHTTIAQLWRSERFVDNKGAAAALSAAAPSRLEAAFREIEERLVEPWALGCDYSALDPYLAVFYRWARRLDMDMSGFPRWRAHNERLFERPAVQAALAIEAAPIPAASEVS